MKASETKFQPIVEGTKQYVVPLFQRPYSWTAKEWEVLWTDLVWLCENNEPKSHFIGSIVTMPSHSVPEGVAKFLLIDGQQRLTTIFVLLALLRDQLNQAEGSNLGPEIEQTMLTNPFKKGADFLKLMPTQVDRAPFQLLMSASAVDGDNKLVECYRFFERKLRQGAVDLPTISKVITNRLSVVSIVLEHDDNPHLVFESLNAKGRPLTQADLIRNYFFMRIHVDIQEEVHATHWEPMQRALGDNLTEYVRHYLMRNGDLVKQGDVYFTLKDRVSSIDAVAALKELALFATYYRKLLRPEDELNARIRTALQRLNRLEISTTYPFLLACYHDYAQKKISAEVFEQILDMLENYIVRRFVCNVPTSQLNKIFPLLYTQALLADSSNLANGVRKMLQSRNYPKDPEFRTQLIDSKLYGAGDRLAKTRLILESLESAYAHKEQASFNNFTIEHVMPQTLTPWWQTHLGEDWQIDHELLLNTLGNLTLTAYNSELSNDPYPHKRELLATSHVELNKYFADVSTWTRKDIEARSELLADLALAVWPYWGDDKQSPVSGDTVTGKVAKSVKILGQRVSVTSWRDVQSHTLSVIAELEPDLFQKLAVEYPRFISSDPGRFRRKRKLENGYFIEMNLSARDVRRFCTQAIESIGLSADDWVVETE
jgi:uncharacterized protein with ParB-like and HNH nuclease domain